MSEENELLRQQMDEMMMEQEAERVAAENKRLRRQLEEMWKPQNAERAAWKAERENQARVEALNVIEEFRRHRSRTAVQM